MATTKKTGELPGMPKRRHDVTITVTGKTRGFLAKLPKPGAVFDELEVTIIEVHAVEEFAPDDEGHKRHTIKLVANIGLKNE